MNKDIKMVIHKFPYDVGGQHTCLSRRIPGFESRYGKHISFVFVYCFVLKVNFTHRQEHTIYPYPQGGGESQMVIFIYYSQTHLFILLVVIIKDTHPFRFFTSIDIPEMGITASHKISLLEFTKIQSFKINWINDLSLSDYWSSAEKLKHLQLYPQIFFSLNFFLLLFKCKLDMKLLN